MASLVGQQLKDTYDSLLKTSDNDALGGTYKEITDGSGNGSGLYLGTGGNVGIGVSPTTALDVAGDIRSIVPNTDNARLYLNNSDTQLSIENGSGNMLFTTAGAVERMRIDSSGNVGIGTDSPNAILDIKDSGPEIQFTDSGNTSAYSRILGTSTGTLYIDSDLGNAGASSTILFRIDGGSEKMRIDSSGNVLVGMTTYSVSDDGHYLGANGSLFSQADGLYAGTFSRLTDDGDIVRFRKDSTVVGSIASVATGKIGFYGSGGTGAVIDSSGQVGIGTDSPDANLHVSGSGTQEFRITSSNGNPVLRLDGPSGNLSYIQWNSAGSAPLTFYDVTTSSERMRIDSSGRLLSGTESALDGFSGTAQRACFSATGDTMTVQVGTSTGAYTGIHVLRQNSNGKVLSFERNSTDVGSISVTTTATAYNTSSDYRLKENIVELDGALDKVLQLKPSTFNFKSDTDSTVSGFIAHEVQEVVPEAVTGEKDGMVEYEVTPAVLDDEGNVLEEAVMGTKPVYQGIDHSKLVPILVGAIQELKAEIEQLKAK